MSKKTRLIILLSCVSAFFIISPILVLYSMGYRVDIENRRIVATGGIYVRTFPTAEQILIDSAISEKPGLFGNSIFVQSLIPRNHNVLIKKAGYYDYSKILPVLENQVTKIENVFLIKKDIGFSLLENNINGFSAAPNNQNAITFSNQAKSITFDHISLNSPASHKIFSIPQTGEVSIKWSDDSTRALISIQNSRGAYFYYFDGTTPKPAAPRLSYLDKTTQQVAFDPQDVKAIFYSKNKTLYLAKENSSSAVLGNLLSFKINGANIIWLSSKGTLYSSDLTGKSTSKLSSADFPVNLKKEYQISSVSGIIFLKENNDFFRLNPEKKIFELFEAPLSNYQILPSSDGKNIIYWNDKNIYVYSSENKKYEEILKGEKISNLQWMNNDYIIFALADKIIISEIDCRGNVNMVTLPQTITSSSMFFNHQNGKIYLESGGNLLASEKITP